MVLSIRRVFGSLNCGHRAGGLRAGGLRAAAGPLGPPSVARCNSEEWRRQTAMEYNRMITESRRWGTGPTSRPWSSGSLTNVRRLFRTSALLGPAVLTEGPGIPDD